MGEDSNAATVNGKIVIGLDTDNGMLLPYAGHELFHLLKNNNGSKNMAKELQSFIIDTLKSDAGYDYDTRFNELQESYNFKGTEAEITEQINEEIAGNACFTVLSQENNFTRLVKQNKSLAQRVKDFFADFVKRIEERLVRLSSINPEYHSLENKRKTQQKILEMFEKCLENSNINNIKSTGIKFSKKIEDYSYNEKKIIEGYLEAIDFDILNFYDNAVNNISQNPKLKIGKVTPQIRNEIFETLGVDTLNWDIKIEDRIAKHINREHGINGKKDHSMANSNDIARMKFIIENHDYYGAPITTNAYKINVNGHNKNASTITFAKKINGTYYLVMAVPNNKTLWIVTVFLNKKIEAAQFRNASNETLRHTSKNVAASTSINSISKSNENVKFSLKESVEQKKDLVAVHNLSEEKMLKSLSLGGLPMPSIAIAKAKSYII
ncbi:MAG: hypothetical protein ACI4IR_01200 [Eubacterium sp.]